MFFNQFLAYGAQTMFFNQLYGDLKFMVYSDASFDNAGLGRSQMGYVCLLADQFNNQSTFAWKSKVIRRVTTGTFQSELLAALEALDFGAYIGALFNEIGITKKYNTS